MRSNWHLPRQNGSHSWATAHTLMTVVCCVCEYMLLKVYVHTYIHIYILVDGLNLRKNISQMGLLFPIFGKIIQMFQTTNQYIYIYTVCKNSTNIIKHT